MHLGQGVINAACGMEHVGRANNGKLTGGKPLAGQIRFNVQRSIAGEGKLLAPAIAPPLDKGRRQIRKVINHLGAEGSQGLQHRSGSRAGSRTNFQNLDGC